MRTLKQVAVNMADAFTRFGLWKGGGSGGSSALNAEITELWSGQQSSSSEITLSDDYANYDVIISMVEPLVDYPSQQKFDFMLKGETSLTGGMCENNNYIAQYRLKDWNGTNVYFLRDTSTGGWNVTLRKIWGLKFVSQQHEYSTEEKVVGKWIDGKSIYEKVIITNITWNGDSQQNVKHGISDLDKIITWQTMIGNYSLPYNGEKTYQLNYNETNLVYKNNANWNNYELKTIIQYTKTTD